MSALRAPGFRPALLAWLLLLGGTALAQSFPPLTGRVVDQAGILSPATEASLTQKLAALEARNGAQLVVATVRSLEDHDIRDYGYRLGRAWGIGQQKTNNGAIFLVAPNDKQVAVEVGYGLEGVLTDAYANRLLDEQVIPRFRQGQIEAGVTAGVDALAGQIGLEPGEARARIAAAEAQTAAASEDGEAGIVGLVVGLLILWFILSAVMGLGRRGRRRRHRGGGVAGDIASVVLWSMLSSGGRGGGWGGGGGGWGGGGGGGFSGGGGSFGGGGASGSW